MLRDFPFPNIPQLDSDLNLFLKWFVCLVVLYLIFSVVELILKFVVHSHSLVQFVRRISSTLVTRPTNEEEQAFVV